MERLIEVLDGRWNCQVTYAPNPQMPGGGTGTGWELCRVGPGRSSVLFDTRATGERGAFEGAGFITWNTPRSAYDLHSLTSTSPEMGVFTGRWQDGDVIFDGYEYVAGQRFASRHSIADIDSNAPLHGRHRFGAKQFEARDDHSVRTRLTAPSPYSDRPSTVDSSPNVVLARSRS
jgi:hypothetical protein